MSGKKKFYTVDVIVRTETPKTFEVEAESAAEARKLAGEEDFLNARTAESEDVTETTIEVESVEGEDDED